MNFSTPWLYGWIARPRKPAWRPRDYMLWIHGLEKEVRRLRDELKKSEDRLRAKDEEAAMWFSKWNDKVAPGWQERI